jgi:hypothetical protein
MVEGALTDRTQPAVSVETAFFVVVEVSADDDADDVSDFAVSDFALESPLDELFAGCLLEEPGSLLPDVIDEDSAPRLSVL